MTKGRLAVVGAVLCALLLILNRPAPASGPPPEPFVFPPPGVTAIGSVAVPLAKGTQHTQGAIAKAVAAAGARATPRACRVPQNVTVNLSVSFSVGRPRG